MKKETKDLIIWIKKQINLAKENCINPCHKDGYPEYETDYEKAMNFLDSLPEIESKLCQGGYIQDVNGVPCCNGDKVKIIVKEGYRIIKFAGKELEGNLAWNKEKGRFYVITRNKDFEFEDLKYPAFTKVE